MRADAAGEFLEHPEHDIGFGLIDPAFALHRLAGAAHGGHDVVAVAEPVPGELPRGDVAAILGSLQRQARRVTSVLLEREILLSESARAPLRLAFPARLASHLIPGPFTEVTE